MAWQGPHVEDHYGSGLQLHLEGNARKGALVGRYARLKPSGGESGPEGVSKLKGSYELVGGKLAVRGTWARIDGTLSMGLFEMTSGEEHGGRRRFEGWWSQAPFRRWSVTGPEELAPENARHAWVCRTADLDSAASASAPEEEEQEEAALRRFAAAPARAHLRRASSGSIGLGSRERRSGSVSLGTSSGSAGPAEGSSELATMAAPSSAVAPPTGSAEVLPINGGPQSSEDAKADPKPRRPHASESTRFNSEGVFLSEASDDGDGAALMPATAREAEAAVPDSLVTPPAGKAEVVPIDGEVALQQFATAPAGTHPRRASSGSIGAGARPRRLSSASIGSARGRSELEAMSAALTLAAALEAGEVSPNSPVTSPTGKAEVLPIIALGVGSESWDGSRLRPRLARLVASVHMERYGMLCAWIFLVQTLAQTVSSVFVWQHGTPLNILCNTVYSATYCSFLVAYALMHTPPDWKYVAGVALYFLGYVCFFALYVQLADIGGDSVAEIYHAGSWCFLTGSVLLMIATRPRDGGPEELPLRRFSPRRSAASLWWGSTSFFLGSALFCADAAGCKVLPGSGNVVAGLAIFTVGRVFFVRGSQTRRCNVLFRREGQRARAPSWRPTGRL